MAEDYDPSLDYDPSMLTPSDVLLAQAQARSSQLRGEPVPAPQPPQAQPQARRAPGQDYRDKALALLERSMAAGDEQDNTAIREYAKRREEDAREQFKLGLLMSAKGGSAFSPLGGQIFKQALAMQGPEKFAGGLIDRGEYIADPEAAAQKRAQRLETQAKIYESMAQHAETIAERERAAREAALLRRAIADSGNQTKLDVAAQKAQQGRPLPAHAVEQINKNETKVAQFSNLLSSWKPEYGGLGTGIGNLSGRYNPLAGDEQRAQAAWWQQYQEFVNDMRHGQFGSALTPTEKAEFEKAIVTSDTDPRVVAGYLAKQKQLAEIAHQRALNSYARGGFNVSGFQGGDQPTAPGAPAAAPGAPSTPPPGAVQRIP